MQHISVRYHHWSTTGCVSSGSLLWMTLTVSQVEGARKGQRSSIVPDNLNNVFLDMSQQTSIAGHNLMVYTALLTECVWNITGLGCWVMLSSKKENLSWAESMAGTPNRDTIGHWSIPKVMTILVLVDQFSKLAKVYALPDQTSATGRNNCVSRFGFKRTLL